MSDKQSTTKSSSTSKPWFPAGVQSKLEDNFNQQIAAAPVGETDMTKSARSMLTDVINGKYLTPDSNPYLAGTASAINRQGMESFNSALARARQTAQQQIGGSNVSVKSNLAADETARRFGQDMTDKLNALYSDQYNRERQNQMSAAGESQNFDNAILNRALSIASLLKGQSNTGVSNTSQPLGLTDYMQMGTGLASLGMGGYMLASMPAAGMGGAYTGSTLSRAIAAS